MLASPKACRESGCGKTAVADGRGFCADHKTHNSCVTARAERYKHDAVSQMYATARWKVFRGWVLRQNPICCRILKDGTQCHKPSKIAHHLWSPRVRPDLFTDPKNVVMLCEFHHPNEEGTPYWRVGKEYVETQVAVPSVG